MDSIRIHIKNVMPADAVPKTSGSTWQDAWNDGETWIGHKRHKNAKTNDRLSPYRYTVRCHLNQERWYKLIPLDKASGKQKPWNPLLRGNVTEATFWEEVAHTTFAGGGSKETRIGPKVYNASIQTDAITNDGENYDLGIIEVEPLGQSLQMLLAPYKHHMESSDPQNHMQQHDHTEQVLWPFDSAFVKQLQYIICSAWYQHRMMNLNMSPSNIFYDQSGKLRLLNWCVVATRTIPLQPLLVESHHSTKNSLRVHSYAEQMSDSTRALMSFLDDIHGVLKVGETLTTTDSTSKSKWQNAMRICQELHSLLNPQGVNSLSPAYDRLTDPHPNQNISELKFRDLGAKSRSQLKRQIDGWMRGSSIAIEDPSEEVSTALVVVDSFTMPQLPSQDEIHQAIAQRAQRLNIFDENASSKFQAFSREEAIRSMSNETIASGLTKDQIRNIFQAVHGARTPNRRLLT